MPTDTDTPAAPAPGGMLQDPGQVQAAANALVASADGMKARRRRDLDAGRIDTGTATRNVADETSLRTKADTLYIHAAANVVAGLQAAQADLEAAIADANDTLDKVAEFTHAADVLSAVIALAAAMLSRQPAGILGALQGLKDATAAVKPKA